jgi:hypothetical protein
MTAQSLATADGARQCFAGTGTKRVPIVIGGEMARLSRLKNYKFGWLQCFRKWLKGKNFGCGGLRPSEFASLAVPSREGAPAAIV